MKRPVDMIAYMSKARRTLAAARSLLKDDATEGACNRAYYAMFYAAQAALLAIEIAAPDKGYKTHNGLIAAFGQHLVLGHYLDADLGRAINEVERLRMIADYLGDPPTLEDTRWAVEQAEAFVAAIAGRFFAEPREGGA